LFFAGLARVSAVPIVPSSKAPIAGLGAIRSMPLMLLMRPRLVHGSHGHRARRRAMRLGRKGYTLIELLVVIIVIGLLAGLVAPQIIGRVSDARVAAAKAQLELFDVALESYRLDNGRFPTTEQGLAALRERPAQGPAPLSWRGPYLKKPVPLDPWGNAYVYRAPGTRNPGGYDLLSLGRDGKPGGTGEDADLVGQ
jgi:general secretion pathway protein G